jgi:phosphatidylserine decarboxylase
LISEYGLDVVIGVILAALALVLLVWWAVDAQPIKYGVALVAFAAIVFTLFFFRDPDRVTPGSEGSVIAPADGTVVLVGEVEENDYLRGPACQIAIFMSPLNVHVNRYPIDGTVGYFRHIDGEYLVAFDDKSSLRNERTLIGIENGRGKVLFKQIAGFIARRIVAKVHMGDHAKVGQRFGMIKFGSRVDVLVPRGAEIKVKEGDKTVAGETVIAVLP